MGIPEVYRKGSDINAQYNYYDVAEGTGINIFYGTGADASGAVTRILSTQAIPATKGYALGGEYGRRENVTPEASWALTAFNTAKTIKGTAYVHFSWTVVANAGPAAYASGAVTAKIYKNGTVIGSAGTTPQGTNANATVTSTLAIPLTKTSFKTGDVLNLGMVGTGTGDYSVYVYCDPNNGDFAEATPNITAATNTTKLSLYIPFDLDL